VVKWCFSRKRIKINYFFTNQNYEKIIDGEKGIYTELVNKSLISESADYSPNSAAIIKIKEN
jgi:hypothetical protein